MSDVLKKIRYKGYTIQICADSCPESPRDWDNLGTMACYHSRYTNFGDKDHGYPSSDYESLGAIAKAIEKDTGGAFILPVYMMEHSGISLSTDATYFRAFDAAGWDWGTLGLIFVAKSKVREEWKVKRISPQLRRKVLDSLVAEVEAYSQYVNGEVYGYIITKDTVSDEEVEDGEYDDDEEVNDEVEEVDSCWGMFGWEYTEQEAKAFIDFEIEQAAKEPVAA